MRRIAALASLAALAAVLFLSSAGIACENKTCHADFDCDPHQVCMQWRSGTATCEWPGANPVVPIARLVDAKSCTTDTDCAEGWHCDKQISGDDTKTSPPVCMPGQRRIFSY